MAKIPLAQQWGKLVEDWKSCQRCGLSQSRTNVVLMRGAVPCDVLFIGEAPGQQEDTIGQPFVGRSGTKLDEIIEKAIAKEYCSECFYPIRSTGDCKHGHAARKIPVRVGLTNVVGCRPPTDDEGVQQPPTRGEIKECLPRLVEIAGICKPRLIVHVGKEARSATPGQTSLEAERWIPEDKFLLFVDIDHPAYILRTPPAQQVLLVKKAVVRISTAVQEMIRDASTVIRKTSVSTYKAPVKRPGEDDYAPPESQEDIPF